MAVAPGTSLEFEITVAAQDTFEAIPNVPVALQRFDPAIGDFRPLQPGTSDARGRAVIRTAAPSVAGRYRYRAAWAGTQTFRGDTSPEVRVDVEAPA